MSYFVVISGQGATAVKVAAGRLIPVSEAQSYVEGLASSIAELDGSPSLFWDDCESGTSHDLVCAAEEDVHYERSVEASALGRLVRDCEHHGVSVRVWWAENDQRDFQRVPEVTSAAEAMSLIRAQMHRGGGQNIGFAMRRN